MADELTPKTDPPAGGKAAGPVATFWEWLKKHKETIPVVLDAVSSAIPGDPYNPVTKAAGRGALNAGVSTVQTIAEGAAWFDRVSGLGEAIQPGFNEAYDGQGMTLTQSITGQKPEAGKGARGMAAEFVAPAKEAVDTFMGKRSDDFAAQLVEDTSQFLTGFVALGSLRLVQGGVTLAQGGLLAATARGAVVDAAAFDPYEAQLAELAARAPVPGLSDLGELLSVEGDDSAIVARLKRSAAGAILGSAIDGLVAAARIIRSTKKLTIGNISKETQKRLEDTIAESRKLLDPTGAQAKARIDADVKAGRVQRVLDPDDLKAQLMPETVPEKPNTLSVRENPDGTSTVVTSEGVEGPVFTDAAEAQMQINTMELSLKDVDPVPVAATAPDVGETIYRRLQSFGSPGEVPDEDLFQIAADAMRSIAPEDRTRVLGELAQDTKIQSVVEAMSRAHSLNLGKRIADLDVLLEARPHDPVVRQTAVEKVKELMSFDNFRKWVQGERGRGLRIIGRQDDPLMEGVRQAQKASMDPNLPPQTRRAIQDVETVSEAQDAIDNLSAQLDELGEVADDMEVPKNRTDTNAVGASEFSLARARKSAQTLLEKLQKGSKLFEHDPELAVKRADDIREAADAQRTDPVTVTDAQKEAAKGVKTSTSNPIEELSKWIDSATEILDRKVVNPPEPKPKMQGQKLPEEVSPVSEAIRRSLAGKKKLRELKTLLNRANKQLDERLRAKAERLPPEHKQKLYDEVSPISERLKRGTPEAQLKAKQNEAKTSKVAGMTPRFAGQLAVDDANIRQITRMFRMAGGSPKDVTAAINATNVLKQEGWHSKILEVFTNSILSGVATAKTVFMSGWTVGSFEAFGKISAGAFTRNRALSREGIDILYGNFHHLADNFRIARRALNEGQSIINPAPVHHAISGMKGDIVRIPGSVLLAGDEFTRVTNYRSYIRAKSLRQGREWGLTGDKLQAHVEADLKAAFDPETGIATIPEALQYAERSTLSGPLGINTVGGKFGTFIRETPGLQFLAPFTKATTNMYRFTTMHTPGLARLNAEARAIMAAGGEEAAVLQAKQGMASSLILLSGYLTMTGAVTGDAPGDPAVRDLWLKNNQPYSVRIGDKWYSYRRTDPFGIMMGLAADFVQFAQQMDEHDPELDQLAYALISSVATGVLTPTYMKGMGDFLDAFADGDPTAIERWVKNFSSSFVPNVLGNVNTDPYYRETRSIADAWKNRIPGLSQTLDPKFDLFGEPVLRGGVGNRSALFKSKDATPAVENELLKLGVGFAPFPTKTPEGIDISDRKTYDNGTGVSPYRRLMELIGAEDPETGKTLRNRVEDLVQSEKYQNASPGTAEYPGGERYNLVARLRSRAYTRAFRKVKAEYPLLAEEMRRARRLQRAAFRGGESALEEAETLFGELQQRRPIRSSKLRQR